MGSFPLPRAAPRMAGTEGNYEVLDAEKTVATIDRLPRRIDERFGGLMEMEVAVIPSEVTLAGSPAQFAAAMTSYMDAGLDHFVLDFQRHGIDDCATTIEQMEVFAETVAPLFD